jgi:hypothetical protein
MPRPFRSIFRSGEWEISLLPSSRYKGVLAELRNHNMASVNDGTKVGNLSVSMDVLGR